MPQSANAYVEPSEFDPIAGGTSAGAGDEEQELRSSGLRVTRACGERHANPRPTDLLSIQFMKTKLKLFQARLFCAVALGIVSSLSLAAGAAEDSAGRAPAKTSQAIPWS